MVKGYIRALKTEHHAQKLRKQGEAAFVAAVRPSVSLPVIHTGLGILDTVEGCTLHGCLTEQQRSAVSSAYRSVDTPIRYAMSSPPKSGEYLERAAWWKSFLLEYMGPAEAAGAMANVIRWYRRCLIGRKTGVWHEGSLEW